MGNNSAQGSWQLFLQCFPQSNLPQALLSISSPLYLPSDRAQGMWLQTEFCGGLLSVSLHLQLSLLGGQKPCCFSQLDVIWAPFQLWCYRLGSPTWGLDPTHHRWNLLATEISYQNFICCPWEPSQPMPTSSALPPSLMVVKWFPLSVCGKKASLQLVFSWLFRMIYLQFSHNSRLVLGD